MAENYRTRDTSEAVRSATTTEWRRGRLYSLVVLADGPVPEAKGRPIQKKARFPRKARNG